MEEDDHVHEIPHYFDEPDAPPPSITSAGVVATDITLRFRRAVKDALTPGSLIKDGYFSLFDSVSALEIMDPKMDSGCLAPGAVEEEDYDLQRRLSPAEALGIMDQLLCQEMAWHSGHSLSQTILANVYIDSISGNPNSLDDLERELEAWSVKPDVTMAPMILLAAYCIGMLKSCALVNSIIKSGYYYEEEDFITNTFQQSLLADCDVEVILTKLTRAAQLVPALEDDWGFDLVQALRHRLNLRFTFLSAIVASKQHENPPYMASTWEIVGNTLDQLKKHHDLGVPVPECFSTKIQKRLASTLPPRPIVQLSFTSALEGFQKMMRDNAEATRILEYIKPAATMTFLMLFQESRAHVFTRALLQRFINFDGPRLLGGGDARAFLEDDLRLVMFPGSPLLDPALDNMSPLNPRDLILTQKMDAFRDAIYGPFINTITAMTQNNCRLRRTTARSIQGWHILKSEVEVIEQDIIDVTFGWHDDHVARNKPLTSWVRLQHLNAMELVLSLGFEQDIYQEDELARMYAHLSLVTREKARLLLIFDIYASHRYDTITEEKSEVSGVESVLCDLTICQMYSDCARHETMAADNLAHALYLILVAMEHLTLVKSSQPPYSTDVLRRQVHMQPFEGLPRDPDLETERIQRRKLFRPTPEEKAWETDPEGSVNRLLSTARRRTVPENLRVAEAQLKEAKERFDGLIALPEGETFSAGAYDRWLERVKKGKKAAIFAGLAIAALGKLATKAESLMNYDTQDEKEMQASEAIAKAIEGVIVEFPPVEKRYHQWWVVPKITIPRPAK